MKNKEKFVYCGHRKCTRTECLRHNINTPYNVIILRNKFEDVKDYEMCKHYTADINSKR